MELTEEELKNMSPEQIAELQKKNCIFCHIVAGRVSSKKIYEDDKCLAILDINPANPGHILLMPKEHFSIMPLVPEETISHMFIIAKHLSQSQLRALKAQGTTIMIANGLVAGQRAPHFMIHVIPRKEEDGVGFAYPTQKLAEEDRKKLTSTLSKRISSLFGLEKTEPINLDTKPAKIDSQTLDAEFSDIKEDKPPQKERLKAKELAAPNTEPQLDEPAESRPKKEPPQKRPRAAPKDKAPKKESDSPDKKEKSPGKRDKPDLDLISRLF